MPNIKDRLADSIFTSGFILIHLSTLLVFWAGASWFAVGICVAMYYLRMFGITGGYHRYFSHRTYKTSRFFQSVLAFTGAMALQKGPLWWAAHHRHHHRFSDTEDDVHSPITNTLWWSHVGWIFSEKSKSTRWKLIPDLAKFPELHWLEKNHLVAPVSLAVVMFALGTLLESVAPGLGTSGFQLVVWGFLISTVLLWHGTFTINSLSHRIGRRRFDTPDHSRNNWFLALITMGEGWHNNHHRYLASERQGFYWWEIDAAHYVLKGLSLLGIVWDLKTPPANIYREAIEGKPQTRDERKMTGVARDRQAIRQRKMRTEKIEEMAESES